MDLVQDNQLVLMLGQVKLRLGKPSAVSVRFEVEIDRRTPFGYLQRQGCLADLTRPEQRHSRHAIQHLGEFCADAGFNHPCKYGSSFARKNRGPAARDGRKGKWR